METTTRSPEVDPQAVQDLHTAASNFYRNVARTREDLFENDGCKFVSHDVIEGIDSDGTEVRIWKEHDMDSESQFGAVVDENRFPQNRKVHVVLSDRKGIDKDESGYQKTAPKMFVTISETRPCEQAREKTYYNYVDDDDTILQNEEAMRIATEALTRANNYLYKRTQDPRLPNPIMAPITNRLKYELREDSAMQLIGKCIVVISDQVARITSSIAGGEYKPLT